MISLADAEHYVWGAACDGWHLVKRDDLSVIHERMPPGTSEQRHYHTKARQFFFVLAGEASFELDGAMHALRAGEGIEVAPGVAHTMRNDSNAVVEFLVVSAPRAQGDRVEA
jgi:uncharacterized cupin superfamily protein